MYTCSIFYFSHYQNISLYSRINLLLVAKILLKVEVICIYGYNVPAYPNVFQPRRRLFNQVFQYTSNFLGYCLHDEILFTSFLVWFSTMIPDNVNYLLLFKLRYSFFGMCLNCVLILASIYISDKQFQIRGYFCGKPCVVWCDVIVDDWFLIARSELVSTL